MGMRSYLVLALLAAGAALQAHAQPPAVIDRIDEATLDKIAGELGFKRIASPVEPEVLCQTPGGVPRSCVAGELSSEWKPARPASGYTPRWAVVGSSFGTPRGLTISARGLDCSEDEKTVVCAAVMFASAVPIPKNLKVADFVEVFNNTHPSVRLVTNGAGLLCQRYVLVQGGVTAENLRLSLKDFEEAAGSLRE